MAYTKFSFKAPKELNVKEFYKTVASLYNLDIKIESGPADLFNLNDTGSVILTGDSFNINQANLDIGLSQTTYSNNPDAVKVTLTPME